MEDGSTRISSAESEQPSRPWPPRASKNSAVEKSFACVPLYKVLCDQSQAMPSRLRYMVCLLLLVSMGLLQISLTLMHLSSSLCLRLFANFCTIFLSLFAVQWCQLYSSGLTRTKRAFFDEVNVLETYQPRARTMGHLFMPEPPTPAPEPTNMNGEMAASRNAFIQLRDAHYANEYEHVTKVNRELDAIDRQKQTDLGEANSDQSSGPEIEGPVLIEFQSEPEEEDDEENSDFHI
uniref:Transmembrane protein n=1 Tax=Ascaris lumbricoides TaxID=6252 RepID=A0A0M3HRY0_ASCLU